MKNTILNEIHELIQHDLATSRQLLALLQKENELTTKRDFGLMAQLLKEKQPLIEELKLNAQQRSAWLVSLNYQPIEKNWGELLESLNQLDLKKQWDDVKETIEYCQNINDLNGKLINRGLSSHERLLQLMRGNTQQADTYNAYGTKHTTSFSGTVTQA